MKKIRRWRIRKQNIKKEINKKVNEHSGRLENKRKIPIRIWGLRIRSLKDIIRKINKI